MKFPAPEEFSPEQFELFVRDTLDSQGVDLQDYVSNHQEPIITPDGEYIFDVTVRFSAMGVSYLTLIECKRYKDPVKRERVELLWSRMQSVSAHKGILFSTSGFQSGAIEYAKSKNIGLVTVADGRSAYEVRAEGSEPIPWDRMPDGIPRVVGWVIDENRLARISDTEGCRLRDLMPDLFPVAAD
jgi:restriction system protein